MSSTCLIREMQMAMLMLNTSVEGKRSSHKTYMYWTDATAWKHMQENSRQIYYNILKVKQQNMAKHRYLTVQCEQTEAGWNYFEYARTCTHTQCPPQPLSKHWLLLHTSDLREIWIWHHAVTLKKHIQTVPGLQHWKTCTDWTPERHFWNDHQRKPEALLSSYEWNRDLCRWPAQHSP